MGERFAGSEEVRGSNPLRSIEEDPLRVFYFFALIQKNDRNVVLFYWETSPNPFQSHESKVPTKLGKLGLHHKNLTQHVNFHCYLQIAIL